MYPSDALYQLALTRLKGVNPMVVDLLLERLGALPALFTSAVQQEATALGLRMESFHSDTLAAALHWAEQEMAFVEKGGITPLFYTHDRYPHRLRECPDAPLLLYAKGDAQLNAPQVISIVGTRHATNYGKGFLEDFVAELSTLLPQAVIVSGLAYGIDIAAHRAALKQQLPTVAVLAHPLNTIYPAPHRLSAIDIVRSSGALLTEYASTDFIGKHNFVARNRIVAGMADAILVIESASKGGALITAGIATSYNRDLFALPGRVGDPYSAGCNHLIASGRAALLHSTAEFVQQMCWQQVAAPRVARQAELFVDLNEQEQLVLDTLVAQGEAQINQLCIRTNIPASRLLSLLLELEFKGLVRTFPGGVYRPKV